MFKHLCTIEEECSTVKCVLQAQIVDLRSELCEVRATKSILDREVHNLLLQLHACQLQLHMKNGVVVDSADIKAKLVCKLRVRDKVSVFVPNLFSGTFLCCCT
jgi:hypothetical protein